MTTTSLTPEPWLIRPLISFHVWKQSMQEWFDKYAGGTRPDVFLDSGAYSAVTTGVTIDLDTYIGWLHANRSYLTAYSVLDCIGDHKATAENQRIMEAAGLQPLPCFHVGEPWTILEAHLEKYDYVALGGMVPHKTNRNLGGWIARAFDYAQASRHRGTPVYHGFGMTNAHYAKRHRWRSIDSSRVSSGVRFGHLLVWDNRIKNLVQLKFHQTAGVRKLVWQLRDLGINPAWFLTSEGATRERRLMVGGATLAAMEWHLRTVHVVDDPALRMRVYLADSAAGGFRGYESGARLWKEAQ